MKNTRENKHQTGGNDQARGKNVAKFDCYPTLGESLPKEIERCQQLLLEYEKIQAGAFGAGMITQAIKTANKAIIDQDLPAMIRAYEALIECE